MDAIIRDQGLPCFPVWLDFHERYAGYVEVFGRDTAVWGLVHDRPNPLLVPRQAEIEFDAQDNAWDVTCADVHPSYEYKLDDKGEFGRRAESFDVYVERLAIRWDFRRMGPGRALRAEEFRGPAATDDLRARVEGHLVPEASDRFSRYYVSENLLLVADAGSGVLRTVWQRTEPESARGFWRRIAGTKPDGYRW